MQFKKYLMTATLITISSFATIYSANAETATGEFKVGLEVQSVCNLTAGAGSDIDLGSVSDGSVKTGTNNISVACSTGTPYKIGFLARNDSGAGGVGVLKGTKNYEQADEISTLHLDDKINTPNFKALLEKIVPYNYELKNLTKDF